MGQKIYHDHVIGIDPATHCGWAVLNAESGAVLNWGDWDLSAKRHEGGGMRFVRMRRYLLELLANYPKSMLAYEEVRGHMGVDAAHVYGGIVGQVQEVCESNGIPYRGIPVGTVKKLATGKGNSGKEAVIQAAADKWPHLTKLTDNMADALWIAEALRQEVLNAAN